MSSIDINVMKILVPSLATILTAIFTYAKWHSSSSVNRSRSNRESLKQLSEAYTEDFEYMTKRELLIFEEALSLYYKNKIYANEFSTLKRADSQKRATESYLKNRRYLQLNSLGVKAKKLTITEGKPFHITLYVFFALSGFWTLQSSISSIQSDTTHLANTYHYEFGLFVGAVLVASAVAALIKGVSIPELKQLKEDLAGIFIES